MKELKPDLNTFGSMKTQIKTSENSKFLIASLFALPVSFWLFYRNYATVSYHFNSLSSYLKKLSAEKLESRKDSSNHNREECLKQTSRAQRTQRTQLSDDFRSNVDIKSLINKFDHLFATKLNSYTKKIIKNSLKSKSFKEVEMNSKSSKKKQVFEDVKKCERSQTLSSCSLFLKRTSSCTDLTFQFNDQINEIILEIERLLNFKDLNEQNEECENCPNRQQEKEQFFALILVLIKYLGECNLENKLQIVNLFKKLPRTCVDLLNLFDCIELIELLKLKFNETNSNLFENYNFQNVEGDADTDALLFVLKLLNNSTQNEQNKMHLRQLMCLPRTHLECFLRLATCYLIDLRKCRNNVRRIKKLEEIRLNTLAIINNLIVHFKLDIAQSQTKDVCLLNPFASLIFKTPFQRLEDFHMKSTNVNLKQICDSFQSYLCLIRNLFALLIENQQLLDQVRFILAKKSNSLISYLLSDDFVEGLNALCEFEENRFENCIHTIFDLFIKLKTSLFQNQEETEGNDQTEMVRIIQIDMGQCDSFDAVNLVKNKAENKTINQETASGKESSSVLSLIEVSHL